MLLISQQSWEEKENREGQINVQWKAEHKYLNLAYLKS